MSTLNTFEKESFWFALFSFPFFFNFTKLKHIKTPSFLPPNLFHLPKQSHPSLSLLFMRPKNGIFHETRPVSVSPLLPRRRLLLLLRVSSSGFVRNYQQSEFSRWVCVRDSFFRLPGDIPLLLLLLQTYPRKDFKILIICKKTKKNQFEGAVNEGNKGQSIWDTFTKKSGISNKTNPEK